MKLMNKIKAAFKRISCALLIGAAVFALPSCSNIFEKESSSSSAQTADGKAVISFTAAQKGLSLLPTSIPSVSSLSNFIVMYAADSSSEPCVLGIWSTYDLLSAASVTTSPGTYVFYIVATGTTASYSARMTQTVSAGSNTLAFTL